MKKPIYVSCTETTVIVRVEGAGRLEYKEYPEDWSAARSLTVEEPTITVHDLNPGSTYNFRLATDTEQGPELVVDTQAPNCTPKPRRCCSLM